MRAAQRSGSTANQAMNNAAVAEDGSLVTATSDDRSFYVLDGSGNLLWREVLGIDVRAVAIYGTGERARVVIGSDDGYVTIYNRDGGTLLSSRLDYDVQSLAVTANGRWIVAGTSDGLVSLLDGSNGKVVWQYKAGGNVTSVAMTADAGTILAGSRDKKAYLLDGDGKLIQAFSMQSEVLATAISGDGAVLVIGGANNRAVLTDRHAAEASHTQAQARSRLINGIVLASSIVIIAAAVAYFRGTPAGRHVWRQGTARPRGLLRSMWREAYRLPHDLPDACAVAGVQLLPCVLRPVPCLHGMEPRRAPNGLGWRISNSCSPTGFSCRASATPLSSSSSRFLRRSPCRCWSRS